MWNMVNSSLYPQSRVNHISTTWNPSTISNIVIIQIFSVWRRRVNPIMIAHHNPKRIWYFENHRSFFVFSIRPSVKIRYILTNNGTRATQSVPSWNRNIEVPSDMMAMLRIICKLLESKRSIYEITHEKKQSSAKWSYEKKVFKIGFFVIDEYRRSQSH